MSDRDYHMLARVTLFLIAGVWLLDVFDPHNYIAPLAFRVFGSALLACSLVGFTEATRRLFR